MERIAVGPKERRGRLTRRMAVKVYVRTKKADLAPREQLPRTTIVLLPNVEGLYVPRRVPVDVVWHTTISFSATPGDFLNPVPSGGKIGVPQADLGTFMCVVRNSAGRIMGLTAGHVVQQFPGQIGAGVQVFQPPEPSSTIPPDASPLFAQTIDGYLGNSPAGFMDYALLEIRDQRSTTTAYFDGFPIRRVVLPFAAVIDNAVEVTKFGAVTRRTFAAFSARVPSINIGGLSVADVLEFKGEPGQPFGARGDSGALVVSNAPNSKGMIVGLLFAMAEPSPDAPECRGYVMPFERLTGLTVV